MFISPLYYIKSAVVFMVGGFQDGSSHEPGSGVCGCEGKLSWSFCSKQGRSVRNLYSATFWQHLPHFLVYGCRP